MSNRLYYVFVFLLLNIVLAITACVPENVTESSTATLTTQTEEPSQNETTQPPTVDEQQVIIPDQHLEFVIRRTLGMDLTVEGHLRVSNLEKLTELQPEMTYQHEIADLTGLEHCVNLVSISIAKCDPLADLSPLASLTKLERLELGDSQVSDLSPLAGCTNLTSLVLYKNKIENISPLASLVNLTRIYILGSGDSTGISDISPLASCTKLERLELYGGHQIRDISPLASCTKLERLELVENRISDISVLANLPFLQHVNLRDNQISDISPLLSLENLRVVSVWGNPLSDKSVNEYLPLLEERVPIVNPPNY